jgi:hypothetical protein
MKFTDLYYECSDLTPDQLKKKVVFLDSLTGGTYCPLAPIYYGYY